MNHYLRFTDQPIPAGQRTQRIAVMSIATDATLGQIRWFPHWRRYVFVPAAGTVFDASCLSEIKLYLEGLMSNRQR